MEKYITDTIYNNTSWERSAEEELGEKGIYRRLSVLIPMEDYIPIEEELNEFFRGLEKEWFYRGFVEGIGFILDLM